MLLALISIISYLAWTLSTLVLVQFILGLLVAFNVLSMTNQYVSSVYHALNVILDPFLKPIQRVMPDTGMLDFSPMVLLIILNIVIRLLGGLQHDMTMAGM